MSLFDSIKNGFQQHFDKKKEDQEFINRLELEAKAQKKLIFEEEYKRATLEVARAQAKKEAAQKSGLQKLRAVNRVRNLNRQEEGGGLSFFEKLGAHTRKNLANREQNLKKTDEMRMVGKQMREEEQAKRFTERQSRMNNTQMRVNKPLRKWQP